MTHDIRDEAFERALRGTLAGLEPGEVPAGLRAAVAAVPRVARRDRPAPRLLFALGGLAAVMVVGVLAIATLTRLPGPTPPIGTEATPTAAPSVPSSLRFELVTDDVFAAAADILDILDARLEAAGYDDATTSVAEGRFLVDVEAEPSEGPRILELLTAPGRVEALATGVDEVVIGEPLAPDAYSVLFHGDEVTSAELVEDPGMPASLQLTLDEAAAARFAEYTGSHVGESFTIAIDGVPATVPAINEPILGGELLISFGDIGVPATAAARDLAAFLVSGQLPTELRLANDEPGAAPSENATPGAAASPSPAPTPLVTIVPVEGSTRLTVKGVVRESCGSIGGCAYDILLTGPGEPIRMDLEGATHRIATSVRLPPGRYEATASSYFVSDVRLNDQPPPRTVDEQCTAELVVEPQLDMVLSAQFWVNHCSLSVAP